MKKKSGDLKLHISAAFVIIAIVALLLIMSLIFKDKSYSSREGRYMTHSVKITGDDIVEGTAACDLESYMSDQFAFRDMWTSVRSGILRFLGNKESNGICRGKTGYLIREFKEPDKAMEKKKIEAIKTYADNYSSQKFYMVVAPNKAEILSDTLPKGAPTTEQADYLAGIEESLEGSKVNFIDVSKTLRNHKDEEIYFKSDDNWTSLGAYYAYREMGQAMGIDMSVDNFEALVVSTSFRGDLAKQSGMAVGKDTINVYFPVDSNFQQVIEYVDENRKSVSVYSSDALSGNYKYDVFPGAQQGLIKINTSSGGKDRLLIIKDSYANDIIPFLMVSYREVVIVDPTIYTGDLGKLITGESINDVLFLYGASSYASDKALLHLLENASEPEVFKATVLGTDSSDKDKKETSENGNTTGESSEDADNGSEE